MNILLDEHKKLLIELLEAGVEFILVGGHAVIFFGHARTTGDMDIWLRPDNQNKEKLIPVLEKYGFLAEDMLTLRNADFSKMVAFHMDEYPKRVDFLTWLSGLKFHEAFKNKTFLPLGNHQVPMLHVNDLIVNKLTSGRFKDRADVEALQKLIELKAKKS
jgi:Nucleotidyltransferase of unknown function (DUF6036)